MSKPTDLKPFRDAVERRARHDGGGLIDWHAYVLLLLRLPLADLLSEVERLRKTERSAIELLSASYCDGHRAEVMCESLSEFGEKQAGCERCLLAEVERFKRIDKNLTEYRRKERAILGLPESANHTDHIEAIKNLLAEVEALRGECDAHRRAYMVKCDEFDNLRKENALQRKMIEHGLGPEDMHRD